MRHRFALIALVAAGIGLQGSAQDKPSHILLKPAEAKWGDPPPAMPKGSTFMVVSGDPGKPGAFTVRVKMPAGYKIAPHWHPTDEHVTVLAGTFAMGMGEKFDPAALTDLPAGGYGLMPAQMRHFATAKTAVTIQIHGVGPFALNYVNPADDPRGAATK